MGAGPAVLEMGALVARSVSLMMSLRLAVPADTVGLAMTFFELGGLDELVERAFVMVRDGRQSVSGRCSANVCIGSVRGK